MKSKMVSIICPCYNACDYIENFIESLINQTYKNLQIIFVNDGSTDATGEILERSKIKFKDFQDIIIINNKDNYGVACAVNNGLKHVKGEYLCWADCDDYLEIDNIEQKVRFLENNSTYDLVLCEAKAYDFYTKKYLYDLKIEEKNKKENIFEQLIFGKLPCYSGVFMIRVNKLFEKLDNKEIFYNKDVGQNWQLLVPVAYDGKCGYINKSLYRYYIRKESHSHNVGYLEELKRYDSQVYLLEKILSFIKTDEKDIFLSKIKNKCIENKMNLAFKNNNKEDYKKFYKYYYSINVKHNFVYKIKYIFVLNGTLYKMYQKKWRKL